MWWHKTGSSSNQDHAGFSWADAQKVAGNLKIGPKNRFFPQKTSHVQTIRTKTEKTWRTETKRIYGSHICIIQKALSVLPSVFHKIRLLPTATRVYIWGKGLCLYTPAALSTNQCT